MRSASLSTAVFGVMLLVPLAPLAGQSNDDEAGRRCVDITSKKKLPPLASVLDTVLLMDRLAAVSPGTVAPMLVALVFAKDSARATVRWIDPATGADTVANLLASSAIRPEGTGPWAARLRIRPGTRQVFALAPARYCPPVILSGSGVVMRTVQIQPTDRRPLGGRPIRQAAEVAVSATGGVTEVRLLRRSGIGDLDDGFLRTLRTVAFRPALLEGMPVAGWYRTDGVVVRP